MKNKFTRALSLILCLIMLASTFTVFASAADGDEAQETTTLMINRDFDEGWDFNGFSNSPKKHNFYIDREMTLDGERNHFLRMEFGNDSGDGFFSFGGSNFTDHTILGFSFMVDDTFTYTGRFAYSQISSGTGQNNFAITALSGDKIVFKAWDQVLATVDFGTWISLVYDFDWTAQADSTRGDCTVYAYDADGNLLNQVVISGVYTLNAVRFGKHTSGNFYGQSYCLDNIYFYNSTTGVLLSEPELDAIGYGSKVNASAAKTVDVSGGDLTQSSFLDSSIAMKVGVDYCLLNNETKMPILMDETTGDVYGAPVTVGGKIFIPLQLLLDELGYEVAPHSGGQAYDISSGKNTTSVYAGRNSALVNGVVTYLSEAPSYISVTVGENEYSYLAVCLDDVNVLFPDQYVSYDTMGFFLICKVKDAMTRDQDMSQMVELMKKFIFDIPDETTVREDVAAYTEEVNGEPYAHPYLQANRETFANLRAQYYASITDEIYDETLNKTLKTLVDTTGMNVFKKWAKSIVRGKVTADEWAAAYNRYQDEGYGFFVAGAIEANDTIYLPELKYLPGCEYEIAHADGRHANEDGTVLWTDTLPNGEKAIKLGGAPVLDENGNPKYDSNGAALMQSGTGKQIILYSEYNGGYDPEGGRFSLAETMFNHFSALGYAYQVSGNVNYAILAYEYAKALGDWYHWGPSHFLNNADSAQQYAIGYDFCHPIWKELYATTGECNPDAIRDILFAKAVYAGYSCGILGVLPEQAKFESLTGGVNETIGKFENVKGAPSHGFRFLGMTNNWNCVCNCGMILSCLAVIDDPDPKHQAIITELLVASMNGMKNSGLNCYAPDGSYAESPGYWAYGTNQFFVAVLGLVTATGKDYGFMDTWGIDKTCYFALHIMSSDNKSFNYHDSSMGNIDSAMFPFAGTMLGDPDLIALRQQMVERGKVSVQRFDTYHYDAALTKREVQMPKAYYMEGVQTYTMRSGWDDNALFVGLHGGKQLVNHGNLDSGTWVYHNNKTRIITEMGSENYNVGSYFSTSVRYTFYRTNPEGQNSIFISSTQGTHPYGVTTDGESKIIDHMINEHGSYGVLDMATIYPKVLTAKRGMMATNDYETVVLQDEIAFSAMSTLYWQAHVAKNAKIDLSEDRRTAYVTVGDQILRVSIVSKISRYKFTVVDANDDEQIILDVTKRFKGDYSNEKQYDRYGSQKLVIELKDAILFDCAVALEMVDTVGDNKKVGYEYVEMSTWTPSAPKAEDTFVSSSAVDINPAKAPLVASQTAMLLQNTFIRTMGITDALNARLSEFYRSLITVEFSKSKYASVGSNANHVMEYTGYVELFDELHEYIDGTAEDIVKINRKLIGITIE